VTRHYRHKETGQKFPAVSDIVPDGYKGSLADWIKEKMEPDKVPDYQAPVS